MLPNETPLARAAPPVGARRAWSRHGRGLALLGVLASAGCVPIDGGAFEAVWFLFDNQGRAINDCNCSDPPIAQVAFHLVGTGRNGSVAGATPCEGRSSCVFACHRQTGVTPFDIPPGEYAFTLVALDANGASLTGPGCRASEPASDGAGAMSEAGSDAGDGGGMSALPRCVEAPAQILRQVVRGQATDVNALPLTTRCSDTCAGASSGNVCAQP